MKDPTQNTGDIGGGGGYDLPPLSDDYAFMQINPLKTKCRLFYLKAQFVPRSKHFSSRL